MSNGVDFNDPSHLYLQIEKALKNKIERGELCVGDQIGTHQELAKEYNVSLITIKKAVSDLVAEGCLISRVGKGTFVAEKHWKKIDLSEHKTIGLVLRDLNHQFFSKIVHSVEERAYELGFNVMLSNSSGSSEKEENQINRFREMGVDGLIIASLSFEYKATDYIQKLHSENFPYIMVSYIHDPDYWYVGSNQELGGFMATEHLIKLGYESIGYVHVGKGNILSEVRKNGYLLALQENDRPFDSRVIYYLSEHIAHPSGDRYSLGYEFGKKFRNLTPKPDALFLYSDVMALGFEHALLEQGIKIPNDVALVGFDDVMLAEYAAVPLTTIHQPTDKIGKTAVDIIQKRINKDDVGNRTIFKPSLIVRESCGASKRGMIESSSSTPEEIVQ
jgi:DNA-binding LacI/PurR family transcriptional regulator